MINIISTEKIYDIVNKHPDAINIMAELGFKDILKPGNVSYGRQNYDHREGC